MLDVPKYIKQDGIEYTFVRKVNDILYLYKSKIAGYYECFDKIAIEDLQLNNWRYSSKYVLEVKKGAKYSKKVY